MKNTLKLVSDVPVSVNAYLKPRPFIKWLKSKQVAMVTMYETKEAKDYKKKFKKHIEEEVQVQGWKLSDNKFQHYYVDVIVYFDKTNRDVNNIWKLLLDAVTETQKVWLDDTQVCERVHAIRYDTKNPRVEILIHPVDYVGIFDNQEELNAFLNKCTTCSRGKTNCSIRKKCFEGRIIDEVDGQTCLKYKQKKA